MFSITTWTFGEMYFVRSLFRINTVHVKHICIVINVKFITFFVEPWCVVNLYLYVI